MSEGLAFANPVFETAPRVGTRRALVFLDSPATATAPPPLPSGPLQVPVRHPYPPHDRGRAGPPPRQAPSSGPPAAGPHTERPDARLASALRAEGFTVDAETSGGAGADGERVWHLLRSAREGDLLLIRLPADGGWTSGQLGSMIGTFGRQVGESLAAAVLLIVDFGWSTLDGSAEPVRQLAVAGEPRVAAAALTLTLRLDETVPGPVRTLTDVIAEGLMTRAADLDGDGTISVGDLHAYALASYTAASAARTPILIAYGAVAGVALTPARDAAAGPHAAFTRVLARLGDHAPPSCGIEIVRRVYELHLSAPARELLRRAALLDEGEPIDEILGDAAELRQWGLLGETTTFVHPDVRSFGHSRLSAAERAQTSALLRRRRAGLRTVRPRARLTADRWTTEDQLGHRVYAEAIAAFVRHPETRPPLTIGVKGPWGTGKTSLMRMIQDLLDPGAAGDTPVPIHLPGSRAERALTNAEVLARTGRRPRESAGRAEPDPLPLRQADWRPTVWFNPWMYQNGEQVWAGLAHEIISQVTGRLPRTERERFWLELNLSRVDREAVRSRAYHLAMTRLAPVALGLVATLVLTGALLAAAMLLPAFGALLGNIAAAVGTAGSAAVVGAGALRLARFFGESAANAFRGLVTQPDLLGPGAAGGAGGEGAATPGYRSKTGFLHLVQTDMRQVLDLVATGERPLVVFVDDLDRCSSGTVAQVIEAINLFLAGEFPNCVFVLAMEPEVVVAHVEAAYPELAGTLPAGGRSGLGWRFLEKIVQLPLSVPLLDDADRLPAFVRALLGVSDTTRPADVLPGTETVRPRDPDTAWTPNPAGPRPAGPPAALERLDPPPDPAGPRSRGPLPPARPFPYDAATPGPPGTATRSGAAVQGRRTSVPPVGARRLELWAPVEALGPHPLTDVPGSHAPPGGSHASGAWAAEPPDPVQVSRLQDAIWALRPTTTTLDEAARLAQDALGIECSDAVGGLCAATREAADRVFDDLYSDENAYLAIEFVLPALTFFNPREIKRYVNVFRFYSFLTYRRALAGAPPASDGEVAKLAALAVQWPHLLSPLAREYDGVSALRRLEQAASDDPSWERAVHETGLTDPDTPDGTHLDSLRDLLTRPHPIADLARYLL
ncbi:P-loop NTPase fold protein [Streptosporangium sp. NBC_01755]|uniref:P-loop NTPase fold protein n=1 Tax=Streptosporangium sp. NBC_01755 TaxID=2975949 RepID=UPI002DDA7DB3|nr:P-loop NTPase fold protein [Streptosporangium sp. NBC_01755]WSC98914.1 P-loop NTPase fold protein [Streptosporangium sp. NBC_01755]